MKYSFKISVFVVLVVILASLVLVSCSQQQEQNAVVSPASHSGQNSIGLTTDDPLVQQAMDVQSRYTAGWMQDNNVVGTAITNTDDGRVAITVFLATAPPSKGNVVYSVVPSAVEGVPVVTEVTGRFLPMSSGSTHQVKQTPPIQLGTSGGWRYDLANGYCCSGTLGSLIQKGTTQYVLSNYHVFWGDIVSGGNKRVATAGDPVIQPGMVDISCNANNAQNVATLSGSGSLPKANVDAGYAQVVSGMVRTDGYILEIGIVSATTRSATIGLAVKKSGRTTGLTRSTITGLNATIIVQYENECAGGLAFTKTFTGQIIVKNTGSGFLNSGDSGSLMVEDVSTNPKAVGLLFAGSSTTAVANPINDVLTWAGATMVGK